MTRCLAVVLCTLMLAPVHGAAAAQCEPVSPLSRYVEETLARVESSGRLEPNPGVDGADFEAFIALLEEARLSQRAIESAASCAEREAALAATDRALLEQLALQFGTRLADAVLALASE